MVRAQSRIFPLLVFLLLFYHVKAETLELSLEDAVGQALDYNLGLKKNAIDLAQTEYSAARLWAEIFPGFSLSTGLNILPATPLFTDPGFSYNGLVYTFNMGFSLALNPSFRASMRRIELAYRSQVLSYESASRQLEIQVVKNFLSLMTLGENISNLEEHLSLAEQKLENDRIARANGLLSELSLLNSRLNVETARFSLSEARGNYQIALGEFLTLLGIDTDTDVALSGNLNIVQVHHDAEDLIMRYLPGRPDIIAQRQLIERLELTRDINVHNSRSPTLNFSGSWGGNNRDSAFSDSVAGSITLNIPVDSWIPGTRQNQSVRAWEADVEKARLDLRDLETSAKTRIRSLLSNLNNTWESLGIARLRVEIAQRTAEAAQEGFNNGTVESLELENAWKDMADARQRLLEREYYYQSMILDLAAALNMDWRLLTQAGVQE